MSTILKDFKKSARKTDEYCDIYESHLSSWREKKFKLLEIGIQYGGSLVMWGKYFPNAEIDGVDIDPLCLKMEVGRATVHIGDQTDVDFLESLGSFDIIIDDGGHTMKQQQTTFNTLFKKLPSGGLYIIEDLHTSYWGEFIDQDKRTTDFLKDFVDDINKTAIDSPRSAFKTSREMHNIKALHFYPSLCIIEKK